VARPLAIGHGRRLPISSERTLSISGTKAAASIACALLAAACGAKSDGGGAGGASGGGRGGPGGPSGPPTVGFVTIQPTSAPITTELAGRTNAFESSDVRPQVSGIIRRRFFTEGSVVRQGQPLYEIDPSLYQAAVAQASANLQSAQANAEASATQATRYAPLARIQAVSQQEYTNAVAQARVGRASVAQNRAALETARIQLRFTTVPAPISGRIGRSLFTVGALVNAAQADPLAQIQRLDPMFVDIQQPSAAILALRNALGRDGIVATRAQVRLKLEDGTLYPQTGTVEFAEALVDTATGTVTLRARFPNPQGLLLPGMFVRANFAQAVDTRAFLVPQQAVTFDAKGSATLFVVGPGDKAVQRPVRADRAQGQYWVVTQGLTPGDRVIVQGLGKVKPNQPVKPVPANAAERIAPPPAGATGGKSGGAAGQGGR
jgi:membrane fusion protein (multidrug efflux system)